MYRCLLMGHQLHAVCDFYKRLSVQGVESDRSNGFVSFSRACTQASLDLKQNPRWRDEQGSTEESSRDYAVAMYGLPLSDKVPWTFHHTRPGVNPAYSNVAQH